MRKRVIVTSNFVEDNRIWTNKSKLEKYLRFLKKSLLNRRKFEITGILSRRGCHLIKTKRYLPITDKLKISIIEP